MTNSSPQELCSKTLAEQSDILAARSVSSEELVRAHIEAIEAQDPALNCFITRAFEEALDAARASDARRSKGEPLGRLAGIPVALKDIFITQGMRTTCASRILGDYLPPYDGAHAERLRSAGAILLGKLNMDEFAMGSSNEFSAFGPVKNPWDLERTPGGSSGGSAAAVAAGLCAASLGSDTGGSIRQPAGFCGVVGVKPTYGRVSRYGMIAFASSLDQAGPMARTVRDAAIVLGAIAGHDPRDSTSLPAPVPDYEAALMGDVKGRRIGIPKEYFSKGLDADVQAALRKAIAQIESLGAIVEELSLPHTHLAVPCYYIIAPAEASANLARFDGVRYGHRAAKAAGLSDLYTQSRTEGFGPEVVLRIVVGTYVLSSGYYDAYYLKAQKVRTLIARDFLEAFKRVEAILTPVSPTPAFRLGEKRGDPIQMYLSDIFTIPANLAGLPGISLPCGLSEAKLPIGMQLIGRPLDEGALLNIAFAYEQATEWRRLVPVAPSSDRPNPSSS